MPFSLIIVCAVNLLLLWETSALSPLLPQLPESPEGMIRQAATAIQTAFQEDHIHRQTIRLALSQAMYSEKEESFVADRAVGWQGGPQETYRYLVPLTQQLLQETSGRNNTSGLTCKIQQQTLLDFDGSALFNTQSPMGAKKDILALIQPNTDRYYVDLIRQMEDTFSDTPGKDKRLFLLLNPAWKRSNDFGLFQAQQAQTEIVDRYPVTYAWDQFVAKGNQISFQVLSP